MWLRDVKDLGGLLEDVRAAEVCLAVVGGDLREAAGKSSGGGPRRRTSAAQTRACRTGSELISHGFWVRERAGSPRSPARISGISKMA